MIWSVSSQFILLLVWCQLRLTVRSSTLREPIPAELLPLLLLSADILGDLATMPVPIGCSPPTIRYDVPRVPCLLKLEYTFELVDRCFCCPPFCYPARLVTVESR